jgi:hypothetical protein
VIHYVEWVILWMNGSFGVGKTTAANLIREREPLWRLFDPEWVGSMLRANLRDLDFDDSSSCHRDGRWYRGSHTRSHR